MIKRNCGNCMRVKAGSIHIRSLDIIYSCVMELGLEGGHLFLLLYENVTIVFLLLFDNDVMGCNRWIQMLGSLSLFQ